MLAMRLDLSSASSVRPSNRELSGRLLVALGRCEMLTAWELAASVYGSRVVVRRGRHWIVSPARLWATRRSLRRLVERGAGHASDTRLQQRHTADKLRNGRCNAVIGGTEVGKNQARQNKAANRRNNLQQQLKARVQYCFLRSGLTQKLTLYPFILSDKYRLI